MMRTEIPLASGAQFSRGQANMLPEIGFINNAGVNIPGTRHISARVFPLAFKYSQIFRKLWGNEHQLELSFYLGISPQREAGKSHNRFDVAKGRFHRVFALPIDRPAGFRVQLLAHLP